MKMIDNGFKICAICRHDFNQNPAQSNNARQNDTQPSLLIIKLNY